MGNKVWNEKRVGKLREMYLERVPYDDISKALGLSKSAICHKVSRLKLPKRHKRSSELTIDVIKELWEDKVKPNLNYNKGCLEWSKASRLGYGQLRISLEGKSKIIQTHRISAMVKENRILKSSEFVCHKCDNPKCCNPEHLFVGTQFDNMKDAYKKGRMKCTFEKGFKPTTIKRGEDLEISKLTEEKVREMRKIYALGEIGHKRIAKMFGVSSRTAYCAIKGITWGHII